MIPKIRPVSGRTIIYLFLLNKTGHISEILKWCKISTGNFIKFENSTILREIRDMRKEGHVVIKDTYRSMENGKKITIYELSEKGIAMGLFYQESLKQLLKIKPPGYRK